MAKKPKALPFDMRSENEEAIPHRIAKVYTGTIEKNSRGGRKFIPKREVEFSKTGERRIKRQVTHRKVEFNGETFYVDARIAG